MRLATFFLRLFRRRAPHKVEDPADFLARHWSEISGSLRVFGDWFGRPWDHWHIATAYVASGDCIKLTFNGGETLEVWGAQGLAKEADRFTIQRAERVRWEWYAHGRPRLSENRFFEEHVVKGSAVEATTNANGYRPEFRPTVLEPAVTIRRPPMGVKR